MVELVYKFDEKSYRKGELLAKVRFKICFGPQTLWTPTLALRMRDNNIGSRFNEGKKLLGLLIICGYCAISGSKSCLICTFKGRLV